MITRYTTESGSVYEVRDGLAVRYLSKGNSNAHRIDVEWKECLGVVALGVGWPLVIEWGTGLDGRSAAAGNEDLDPSIMRRTVTSPVTDARTVD